MARILNLIEQMNKTSKIIVGFLLLVGVALLDFYTGAELSFSLFYLIPIAFFSFAFSASVGIGMAFISAAIWLLVDVLTAAHSDTFAYLWNTIIRLGFFLLPAIMLKSLEQERMHARTDYLTGAINNRYFNEILEREIERSLRYQHPFTIAFIDLDNFKTVNDTFGHLYGDKMLRTLAERMKNHLRKTDVIARVGGDEFAILLPETNEKEARTAISNLFSTIAEEMTINKWPLTFSVGVLTLSAPTISADKILGIVDKMMYVVKNNGKNNIKYATYANEEKITHPQS
jgi:diguanylate cyclase (GGDEF)-like protein